MSIKAHFVFSSICLVASQLAPAATLDKSYLTKNAIIVILDSDERQSIKVGDALFVQEDNTQSDHLVNADVVFIAGNKALLAMAEVNPADRQGQKIHLYVRDSIEQSKEQGQSQVFMPISPVAGLGGKTKANDLSVSFTPSNGAKGARAPNAGIAYRPKQRVATP